MGAQMSCLLRCKTRRHKLHIIRFRVNTKSSFIPLLLLSPKSHSTFRGPQSDMRVSSILRDLHREGANLVRANLSGGSAFPLYWHHILCECHQFPKIVEPLYGMVAISFRNAITVPSKAEIFVTLKVVHKIHNGFFRFGFVFFFGRNLCRRCLHKL